jgi:ketosteroid isomerase-like protein
MSQENVELAKILLPQPGTDIVPLIRDEDTFARMGEAARPFLTDDFESVMVWPAVTRTYAGLEGLRKNWLDWLEPWATYRSNYDELMDVGEHVVVLLRNHGCRKDMETEVELIGATILTFREGKLARWGDYTDRATALESLGLSEQDAHADS